MMEHLEQPRLTRKWLNLLARFDIGSHDPPGQQDGDEREQNPARRLADQHAWRAKPRRPDNDKRDRPKGVTAPIDRGGVERMPKVVERGIANENRAVKEKRQGERATKEEHKFARDPFGFKKCCNRFAKGKENACDQHNNNAAKDQSFPKCFADPVVVIGTRKNKEGQIRS